MFTISCIDSTTGYRPIKLSLDYVDRIVYIHKVAFKGFFLTSLGSDFLKTYYSSCLKNKSTIAIGIIDDHGHLLGFSVGTKKSSGYHKDVLLRNFFPLFFSLFNVFISNPIILLRLFLNLRKGSNKNDRGDYAELLSIAVLPQSEGSGIGKLMLEHFEKSVKDSGVCKITLTTDYYKNDPVIKFYQKNKYDVLNDFIAYPNRKMYKMIKNLK